MTTPSSPDTPNLDIKELPVDFETVLLKRAVQELLRRLEDPKERSKLGAADFREIRMLCESNSVSFASIRKGDFGQVAQRIVEEFPFDAEGNVLEFKAGGSGA